jgi:hypothetical protein
MEYNASEHSFTEGDGVERAVEWFVAITSLVAGASQLLPPGDWADAYRQLHRCGRPGAFVHGALHLAPGALLVAGQLIKEGGVRRGRLGLAGQNVPLQRSLVRFYNLPLETGLFVVSLESGGPAERAGLQEGDGIIQFDGQDVPNIDVLHRLLTEKQVGVPVPVTVLRYPEKLVLAIVPEETQARAEG